MKRVLILLTLFLAACAPVSAPVETAAPQPTVPPPAVVTAAETPTDPASATIPAAVEPATEALATDVPPTAPPPTAPPPTAPPPTAPVPTATPAIDIPATVTSGRTPEGAFFYGDPDAAVTLIDYSDFL